MEKESRNNGEEGAKMGEEGNGGKQTESTIV